VVLTEINDAKNIVLNYIETSDIVLENLLESSKGNSYRPWFVAALEIYNQYEQLIRADVATFQYDKKALIGLLETQAMFDSTDDGVISPWLVSELLTRISVETVNTISVDIH